MMCRLSSLIRRREKGFTLVEMAIALAITGAIAGVITMGIFQTMDYSARDSARMTAVKQVENAVHYMSRDVQQARIITPAATPDPDGFPLTLSWVDWSGTQYQATYTIIDNELRRSYSVNGVVTTLTVARYINSGSSNTNCSYNGVFNLKITSTVTGYPAEISETRQVQITPRSG